MIVEVKVAATDGAARHANDGITWMLDLRVGEGLTADVFFAVPGECFHGRMEIRGLLNVLTHRAPWLSCASGNVLSVRSERDALNRTGEWRERGAKPPLNDKAFAVE